MYNSGLLLMISSPIGITAILQVLSCLVKTPARMNLSVITLSSSAPENEATSYSMIMPVFNSYLQQPLHCYLLGQNCYLAGVPFSS